MNRKTEISIFFATLVIIGVLVWGGIIYFKKGETPSNLLPDMPMVINSQNSTGSSTETIPAVTPAIAANPSSTVSASALTLPYTLNVSTSNETYWPKAWGSVSFTNTSLALIPDPNTHGANSFLNGASSWSNYTVSADVGWLMGGWLDIVARVSNNTQNFVYCEFGSNGTEVVERVNGVDSQIASTAVSSTDIKDSTENFGMKVYGNDIACTIAGKEVVGVQTQNNESPQGGIGFVIFGQPQNQKQVQISKINVSSLTKNNLVVPFSAAAAAPPTFVAPSPVVVAPEPVAIPPPSVTTPPPIATTTKNLPYSASVFNASDWFDSWGGSSVTNGILTVGSNNSIPSGGIFLNGSNSWTNYSVSTDIDLIKGSAFVLVARRTDYSNFIECIFSNINSSVEYISIDRVVNNQTVLMGDGQVFINNAGHISEDDIKASMTVNGNNVQCSIDGATALDNVNNGLPTVLLNGGIGFISWDQAPNNSEIIVKQLSVTPI